MSDDRRPTTPPPSLGALERELSYEELADGALRILLRDPPAALDRVLRTLARVDEENDGNVEAVRQHTRALKDHTSAIEDLRAEVVPMLAAIRRVAERTRTVAELFEANSRDLSERMDGLPAAMAMAVAGQLRETHDNVRALQQNAELEARQTAGTFEALKTQLKPVERVTELATRLGAIEGAVGEAPDDSTNRKGSGMRGTLATLWAHHRQTTKGHALALGGGAAAGVPVAWALYELLKLIAQAIGKPLP